MTEPSLYTLKKRETLKKITAPVKALCFQLAFCDPPLNVNLS